MPKCGIFINFVFYRQLLKNERILSEKKQKDDKTAICVATQHLYVATQNSSRPNELCRSQQIYVNKDWSELKAEKIFLGRDRKVFCRDRT